MSRAEARLAEIGIALGSYREPAGRYVPTRLAGDLLFFAGQLSAMEYDGTVEGFTGKLVSPAEVPRGVAAARACAIGLLERAKTALGDLDRVRQIVRLTGYINAAPTFTETHLVLNGCSDVLIQAFGEAGRHTRLAIGVTSLSFDTTVEVECIMQVA